MAELFRTHEFFCLFCIRQQISKAFYVDLVLLRIHSICQDHFLDLRLTSFPILCILRMWVICFCFAISADSNWRNFYWRFSYCVPVILFGFFYVNICSLVAQWSANKKKLIQTSKYLKRFLSWFRLWWFFFLQRRCHPVTRYIKKIADQSCYNVIFYLRRTEHKY